MPKAILIAAAAVFFLALSPAQADDKAVVEAFYTQLLSAPNAPDIDDRVREVLLEDWVSVPTPRGGKGAAGMVKSLKFFGSTIPDLNWAPQEILQDGNRYIVRSVATGTPSGKFFGVEPNGGGFEIMTIDIHEVENGKIVRSYHVEDWARAIRQISTPK